MDGDKFGIQEETVHEVQEAIRRKPDSWGARLSAVIWDRDDKSEEERRFVRKLDIALLTCGCISYFCKYLNQANVSNAYASGMKEALDFTGNQYNTLNTMFVVGYLIGQLPGPILMTKISPSIWLPAMEIIWSIIVMCCAAAKNVRTMYALRFLIGLAEATAYPGMVYVLGCWYTPSELGKRTVIFISSSSVGTMFSGYLQAAVLKLDGVHGMQGYQWLFIMDGIISICIASLGFFMLPDVPERPNPRSKFWLKSQDIAMARARMLPLNRAPRAKFSWPLIKKAATSWVLWGLFFQYAAYGICLYGYAYMNLWLKAEKYSTSAINLIPTGGYGVQIVASVAISWISDATRSRMFGIFLGSIFSLVGNIILSCWPSSHALKFLGFYLNFPCVVIGPILLTWVNELLSESAEIRVIVIGTISMAIYIFTAWVPNLIFPASKAPHYAYGYQILAALLAFIILGCSAFWAYARKRVGQALVEEPAAHELPAQARSDADEDPKV